MRSEVRRAGPFGPSFPDDTPKSTLQFRREEIGYEFHEASGPAQCTSSRREAPVFLATPIL
jgi:hypothetical protein